MALNGEKKSKISSIFQALGTILFIISFFLILSALGLIPNFPKDQIFLTYGMILLGPAFLFLILSALTGVSREVKKLEQFTTIKCQNSSCKHVVIRDFNKKDFVFKELKESCIKCNSTMYITDISSIPIKKFKEEHKKEIRSKKPKLDKKEKKYKTITTFKCENSDCDFTKTRDFKLNDYIFEKIDDITCSKCGSTLFISEISHLIPEKAS
ncbi:MAG: hypothetical protein HWN67_02155 [Candidatus Helarchaeota archaeon]|nr:hypothetical protein [Candidatus Helarchaeota archaeon]